jgi:uncharacterized LabA/DUF88 family protein
VARVNVYIDGLNQYHRKLSGSPYKWLNLKKLADLLAPNDEVYRVRYFTAKVVSYPGEPDTGQMFRQQVYIRALDTLKPQRVTIHFGLMKVTEEQPHRVAPPHSRVLVYKPEEKGSDVNLASHLILDATRNDFEAAMVVSHDSDLRTPVQIVRQDLHFPVTVAIPGTHADMPDAVIPNDRITRVSDKKLAASQFNHTLRDQHGAITKPPQW